MGADSQIIFFDGVCNLCNASINFIIDRDPSGHFKYASLQSSKAEELLTDHDVDPKDLESIVFYVDGRVYRQSRAVLEIARRMRRAWPIFYLFVIIPPFIRDALYQWIAKNRYRWFGKRDACRMPTPELKARFVG